MSRFSCPLDRFSLLASRISGHARAGLVAGLAVALVATRAITRFLYEVAPFDLVSIAAAIGIVVVLALFAALLPGRRAARTDPARVLADGSQ